jgi:uncharacterized membrane protein
MNAFVAARFMRRTRSGLEHVLELIGVAIVVAAVVAPFVPWQVAVLLGWIAGGTWMIVSVWVTVWRFDADETQALAMREDNTRVGAHVLLVSASVVSLVGTAFELIKANQSDGSVKAGLVIVAIVTVIVSWALVHTIFTLRYAHEYYTPPAGGIDFKTAQYAPDYHDFAYVAFTVGMTFQVSDTDIQSPVVRRTVLRHALLSYLFGAVILAIAINVVAGLLQ